MKDKIFIIWSGSDRAAQLVKRTLEQVFEERKMVVNSEVFEKG